MNKKVARTLSGSLVGLILAGHVCLAHQREAYQLSGQEMIFILMLVALVIGGWIGYESIRKRRAV